MPGGGATVGSVGSYCARVAEFPGDEDSASGSNPSPVPLRLVKTPAAGHPLPTGEGKCTIRYE